MYFEDWVLHEFENGLYANFEASYITVDYMTSGRLAPSPRVSLRAGSRQRNVWAFLLF